MTRALPRIEFGRWSGDGMHNPPGPYSTFDVDGCFVAFAWLGLHFEIALCLEKRR